MVWKDYVIQFSSFNFKDGYLRETSRPERAGWPFKATKGSFEPIPGMARCKKRPVRSSDGRHRSSNSPLQQKRAADASLFPRHQI